MFTRPKVTAPFHSAFTRSFYGALAAKDFRAGPNAESSGKCRDSPYRRRTVLMVPPYRQNGGAEAQGESEGRYSDG